MLAAVGGPLGRKMVVCTQENTQLVSWADWASNLSLAASCLRGFTLFQAFSFSSSETWRQFQTQEQGWELFP